jgi:hypothetical protein
MHTYNLFINLTPNNPDVLDLSYTPISIQDVRTGTYLQGQLRQQLSEIREAACGPVAIN